ncbi:hypothetical protein J3F83DRAFT_122174 [Trichoderma novae-zelandiae]
MRRARRRMSTWPCRTRNMLGQVCEIKFLFPSPCRQCKGGCPSFLNPQDSALLLRTYRGNSRHRIGSDTLEDNHRRNKSPNQLFGPPDSSASDATQPSSTFCPRARGCGTAHAHNVQGPPCSTAPVWHCSIDSSSDKAIDTQMVHASFLPGTLARLQSSYTNQDKHTTGSHHLLPTYSKSPSIKKSFPRCATGPMFSPGRGATSRNPSSSPVICNQSSYRLKALHRSTSKTQQRFGLGVGQQLHCRQGCISKHLLFLHHQQASRLFIEQRHL